MELNVDIQANSQGTFVTILEDVCDLSEVSKLERIDSFVAVGVAFNDRCLLQLKGLAIREINVTHSRCDSSTYEVIPTLPGLEVLALTLTAEDTDSLNHISKCKTLTELHLAESHLNDCALMHICQLNSLATLDLSGTNISELPECISELQALRCLLLSRTEVTDESLKQVQHLRNLTELGLNNTRISDRAIESVLQMASLKTLYVSGTGVSAKGLHMLSQLETIDVLYATELQLDESAFGALSQFKQLRRLVLSKSTFSMQQRQSLEHALPGCQIMWLPDAVRRR